jgi:hypothetical protein
MNRTRGIVGLLAVLAGGAATALGGPYMNQYWNKQTEPADGVHWGARFAPEVETMQGPWGQPVSMAAPYNVKPPNGADAARAMLAQSMPLDLLQQSGYFQGQGMPILPAGGAAPGAMAPPGMAPPSMISPPGVAAVPPAALPPGLQPPGAVAAVGALTGGAPHGPFAIQRTEVRFVGPPGMKISWYGPSADGKGTFGPQFLEAPARYNFLQASIYRLKLSDIPGRPGVELYPTLEVVPSKPKTCTFLAHSAVPIVFTEDDLEQVAAGNFVIKVIYLPDPQFQDLAATGLGEVVSSQLEPGVDPIIEAKRRGSILLVVRLGNIDLEAPNTPAMDAPNPFAPPCPPGQAPGAPPGLPPAPGVPMQMMPNTPPAQPARPAMPTYGMLNGQPLQPGTMEMQRNPMQGPPGMMMAPGGAGMFPVGTQLPSLPNTPVGQAAPPSTNVRPTGYLPSTQPPSSPQRRPTLAELAAPPTQSSGSSATPFQPGSR